MKQTEEQIIEQIVGVVMEHHTLRTHETYCGQEALIAALMGLATKLEQVRVANAKRFLQLVK